MTRNRENVSPKMSSHSAGWIARVISSTWSLRIRCSSTMQNVMTRLGSRHHPGGPPGGRSAEAAGSSARAAHIPQVPSILDLAAGVVAEHVLERRVLAQLVLQVDRRALGH